ncbi:hypothetical protein PMSD_21370 [Paenibacillus macquariensis subsp. defensor]|nr:hypothetical protein PMSD_21370 [Paenibacillus macquariensis subsp. defensor]
MNNLPDETVDELCKKMCTWKDDILTDCYPDMKCPDRLSDAQGRDILRFISVSDIYIYRNPYDKKDTLFGASVLAGMDGNLKVVLKLLSKARKFLKYASF